MGQHDQHERRVTPPNVDPVSPTQASAVDTIDHGALFHDVLPILERHGVIPIGERLDGWVGILRFTGVDDSGAEYMRTDLLTSPGISFGEARQLLADGKELLS